MIGELVAFMMGAGLTALVGIPMAVRLAQVQVWRRPAVADAREKHAQAARTRFEPVDFGPDLIKWPSEMARPVTNIPDPPWPSAGWDDPHFGKAARAFAAAQPAPVVPAQRSTPKKAARPQASSESEIKPKQAPQKQAQPKPKPVQQKQAQPKPRPAPQPEPEVAKVRFETQEAAPQAGQSDKARVEAMVAELGLAGTVQHLMKVNDWDFKTAAGWLAKMRKG